MIRWKVFIPVFLVLALVSWFAIYRLDLFVKGMIENAISAVTGTKTDITTLRISLFDSKMTVKRLEIASKEEPMKNAIEFGGIAIDFQFLPLLQKRFVVDEFSIVDVQWGTPRKTSGLLPPRPKSTEPSWFAEISDKAIDSLKAEFDKLPVSKLTEFEVPNNPKDVLDRMELKSMDAFKQSALEAQQMRGRWTQKWSEMKDVTEYKRLLADAQALVQNLPQDPQEILARVTKVQEILQKIEAEKKKAESLVNDVKGEFSKVQKAVDDAKAAVEADYQKARGLVGFDAFDTTTLTRMIFGKQWLDRAESVLRMTNALRGQLAKMSAAGKDESVQVHQRAKGRDIIFVTPKKQPSFILAKSDFTVNSLEAGDRKAINQRYEVKLRDINSAPKIYGKPTTVNLRGDFKEAQVGSAEISALWDYTKETPRDIYKAEVKRIKAEEWPVGIPKLFPIKIKSGTADARMDFEFIGDSMTWTNQVAFANVGWSFDGVPKSGVIVPILTKVFEGVKNFQMTLKLVYKGKDLDFDITSDLDELLKKGISQVLQQKFQEFQARLKKEIDDRVAAAKAQALNEVSKLQTEAVNRAQGYLAEATQSVTEGNQIISQLQKKAQDAGKKRVEEQLKQNIPKDLKLPGGFKFP